MSKLKNISYKYDFKGKNGLDSRPFISTFKGEQGGDKDLIEKGLDSRPLVHNPNTNVGPLTSGGSQSESITQQPPVIVTPTEPSKKSYKE